MKQLAFATLAVFLLPVLFSGCGEKEPAELLRHSCYYCKKEGEAGKVGEKVCAHCGKDPYGPMETANDLERRVAKMEMENLANELIFRDQLARGDNGSWPWWKWPPMLIACWIACAALVNGVCCALEKDEEIKEKVKGGEWTFLLGVIIYWLW